MQLIESIIDTQKENYDVIGSFNVLDNVELTLEITGSSAPWNNPSFELHGLKSDLTKVRQITGISIVDKANKIVKINLLNQMTTCAGVLQLQLIIRDVNRTSSTIFCVKVNKSLEIDKTTSTDSIKIYADLEELNKNITANEAVRNENEGVRETAEELRQLAETEREEKFNQIETHWNNIKDDEVISEVQNSRTSIFEGEKDSLSERLNTDLSEINRKFDEGQFIEYNDHNITANNSLAGYTKDMKIEGATYQNLVNASNYEITGNINVTKIHGGFKSIVTESVDRSLGVMYFVGRDNCLFKQNTKYTIIYDLDYSSISKIPLFYFSSGGSISLSQNKGKNIIVVDIGERHIDRETRFIFYNDERENNNWIQITNFIVLEGDYTNKPIPSYFKGIKSVGEGEENKISILSCGKNLFDSSTVVSNWQCNYVIENDGSYTLINTTNVGVAYIKTGSVKLQAGKKYSVSANGTGNFSALYIWKTSTTEIAYNTRQFIAEEGNLDICFGLYVSTSKIGNTCNYKVQIEESSAATPYEPYKSDKKDILLPNPLRSLPDGIKDTIEFINNKWCYVQRIDKIILDGNHQMGDYNLDNSKIRNQMTVWIKPPLPKFVNSKAISDEYVHRRLGDIFRDGLIAFSNYTDVNTPENVIYINDTFQHWGIIESDTPEICIQKAREKLKQNPVIVYYELEIPIITPLDINPNLISWEGTTHIFTENSISPRLSCKVSTNIPALLSNLKTENNNLKNDLNENNEKIIDASLYSVENDYRLTLLELGLV